MSEEYAKNVFKVAKIERLGKDVWDVDIEIKGLEYPGLGSVRGRKVEIESISDKRDGRVFNALRVFGYDGHVMSFNVDIIISQDEDFVIKSIEEPEFFKGDVRVEKRVPA